MNSIVIGASGLVGGYLLRELEKNQVNATGTYHHFKQPNLVKLDIRDILMVEQTFHTFNPSIVFLPGAIPNVDLCETDPTTTRRTNVDGVRNVAKICNTFDSELIYFSSDYVFDGKEGHYSEKATPNPINEYGRQKIQAEQIIQEILENFLIIRTTIVFGWELQKKNFVFRLIEQLRQERQISVPSDQYGSPTYAGDLAAASFELVQRPRDTKIFNVAGSEIMPRNKFAEIICEIFDLKMNLICPVESRELRQVAKRPPNLGLDINKAQKVLGRKMMNAKEGLEAMKNESKTEKYLQ